MSSPASASPTPSESELYLPQILQDQVAGMGLTIAQHYLPASEMEFLPLQSHLLTLNLGEAGNLIRTQAGQPQNDQTILMMQGGMTLTPAEQPRHWRWNHSVDVLQLQLQPQLISRIAIASEIDIRQIELVDRFGVYDPQIEFIGRSLLAELQSNGLAGQLYTESLINLLVVHLLRQHSAFGKSLPQDNGKLPSARLKDVLEYIHDHLGQSLSLVELARLANLSPSRFTRVFRQETGLSPHQYVIQARIERAKVLLRSGGDLSLGSIAHQIGFADQSHFTRHFKRIVGVTPKVILQESRNVLNPSSNIQDRENEFLSSLRQ